jgi:hypothetical protein
MTRPATDTRTAHIDTSISRLPRTYAAVNFLIAHGIDLTIRDHRWNATAGGLGLQRDKKRRNG